MQRHTRHWILLICAAIIFMVSEEAHSRQLTIGFGWLDKKPLGPKLQEYLSLICSRADKNLKCEIKFVPFARLQALVIKGDLDGDLARLKDGYDGESSVVLVEEPLAALNFYFVSHKNRVLEDLVSIRRHKTAVDLGSKMQKKMCQDLDLNCEFVGPGSSSLKMLREQRVGTVLVSQLQTSDPSEFGTEDVGVESKILQINVRKRAATFPVDKVAERSAGQSKRLWSFILLYKYLAPFEVLYPSPRHFQL